MRSTTGTKLAKAAASRQGQGILHSRLLVHQLVKFDWKSLSKLLAKYFGSTFAVAILNYIILIQLFISDIYSWFNKFSL